MANFPVEKIDLKLAVAASISYRDNLYTELSAISDALEKVHYKLKLITAPQPSQNLLGSAVEVIVSFKTLINYLYQYQLLPADLVSRQIDRVRLTEIALLGMDTVPNHKKALAPGFSTPGLTSSPVYVVKLARDKVAKQMDINVAECSAYAKSVPTDSHHTTKQLGT